MTTAFLLVTCCLEQSRADLLSEVLKNLGEQAPELHEKLTVFDNASTVPGTIDLLRDCYTHVFQADHNVGYWTAVDWWLQHLASDPPEFTYIIESDMIHYAFNKVYTAAEFLEKNGDVGSVRLHEYSVNDRHLYDKDRPSAESRRGLWQSHTNRVTGKKVSFDHTGGDVWLTTFLTQLPALNRYKTMCDVFAELKQQESFIEPDFQRLYWQRFEKTAILDGGIYHCNLNQHGTKAITGSWTNPGALAQIGYQQTRKATITPSDKYNVIAL